MAKPYSNDLRARVAAAVTDGYTTREAAEIFDVSVSTAVRCGQRLRQSGSAAAKAMGGVRRDVLAGQKEWLRARIGEAADATLTALVAELSKRGVRVSRWAVWKFCRDEQLTFKKKHSAKRAEPARHHSQTCPLADVAGQFATRAPGVRR
jgi:transposase